MALFVMICIIVLLLWLEGGGNDDDKTLITDMVIYDALANGKSLNEAKCIANLFE